MCIVYFEYKCVEMEGGILLESPHKWLSLEIKITHKAITIRDRDEHWALEAT